MFLSFCLKNKNKNWDWCKSECKKINSPIWTETSKYTKHKITYLTYLCWKYKVWPPKLMTQSLPSHNSSEHRTPPFHISEAINASRCTLCLGLDWHHLSITVLHYSCFLYKFPEPSLSKQYSEAMVCGQNYVYHTLRWNFQVTLNHPDFFFFFFERKWGEGQKKRKRENLKQAPHLARSLMQGSVSKPEIMRSWPEQNQKSDA